MIAVIFAVVLISIVNGKEEDFRRLDCIRSEPACSSAGGLCVIASDCEGELTEQRGLCPSQRSQGVECCYGFSVKETRCGKRGGQCVPSNQARNPRLIFSRATDCSEGYTCYILVT